MYKGNANDQEATTRWHFEGYEQYIYEAEEASMEEIVDDFIVEDEIPTSATPKGAAPPARPSLAAWRRLLQTWHPQRRRTLFGHTMCPPRSSAPWALSSVPQDTASVLQTGSRSERRNLDS